MSRGLEAAVADACVARLARRHLDDNGTAADFEARADLYKLYYDDRRKLMAARRPDGSFVATEASPEAFDPSGAYEEGTPLQYLFMVPADAAGLAELLGGPDALGDRLDDYFLRASMRNPTKQLDLATGTLGGHCHGNEPGHHTPYLYNVAKRPWRTAETIRAINAMYTDSEIPGNDDVGQTSAWFVWSALGLYPVDPCGDSLHLGMPLFSRADVDVGGGRTLTVLADDACLSGGYVRAVRLNNDRLDSHEVAWDAVLRGGYLHFSCGPDRVDFARRETFLRGAPPPTARTLTGKLLFVALALVVAVFRRGAGAPVAKEN